VKIFRENQSVKIFYSILLRFLQKVALALSVLNKFANIVLTLLAI